MNRSHVIRPEVAFAVEAAKASNSGQPLVALWFTGFKLNEAERDLIAALPIGVMTPDQWVEYQARALVHCRTLKAGGKTRRDARADTLKRFPLIDVEFLDHQGSAAVQKQAKMILAQTPDIVGSVPP